MNPVRISYPCRYPVKIVGEAGDEFVESVLKVTRRHAPELEERDIRVRTSAEGNYCSVAVVIIATGEEQLDNLHNELKENPEVRLVI